MKIPNLWNVMAPALLLAVEVYSQRTCTSRQVGSHKIVGTCGTHISDTMKDGHPTLFAEGPEGSLLPLVPVKDMPHLVKNTCKRWRVSGGKVVCSNWKLSEMSPTHVKGLEERPAADPWPPVLFPKRPN